LKHDGIELNRATNNGASPLYVAAERGHTKVVRLLLSKSGIDINKARDGGFTALNVASSNNHFEVVRLLLSQSDIDIEMKNFGMTVLTKLQKYGTKDGSEGHLARQTEIIKLLEIHHRE
jgi:ankyrin repeat protein